MTAIEAIGHLSFAIGAVSYWVRDEIVGEMSFLGGQAATATVRAVTPTRYIAWLQPALRRLLARNPAMLSAMRSVFSAELTRKLIEDDSKHAPPAATPPRQA
jgi:CRP-like cAMP-binding protein